MRRFRSHFERDAPGWFPRIVRWSTGLRGRILALNLLVLLAPLIGLTWSQRVWESQVGSEQVALLREAELVASSLAADATTSPAPLAERLDGLEAQRLLVLYGEEDEARLLAFGPDGGLRADSEGDLPLKLSELAPPPSRFLMLLRDLVQPKRRSLARYRGVALAVQGNEISLADSADFQVALAGESLFKLWVLEPDDRLFATVYVPIVRFHQPIGVLAVSRPFDLVDARANESLQAILRLLFSAFLFTLIVSFWLAWTVARPIGFLTRAARRAHEGHELDIKLPRLARRKDEIGGLTRALTGLVRNLRSRAQAADDFAAEVTHEIKNPLTSMRSAVETMRAVKDAEIRERLLDIVVHDVDRLDRLISDISQASRLDAELVAAPRERVDLAALLSSVVSAHNLVQENEEASRRLPLIALNLDSSADLRVWGLESRWGQVLDNLLSNAFSFSPVTSTLELSAWRDADRVRLRLDDSGPGLPADKLETVFNRFFTDRQDQRLGDHSGLGLAVSRQIVEASGGHIWAENLADSEGQVRGARFEIDIPAAS